MTKRDGTYLFNALPEGLDFVLTPVSRKYAFTPAATAGMINADTTISFSAAPRAVARTKGRTK